MDLAQWIYTSAKYGDFKLNCKLGSIDRITELMMHSRLDTEDPAGAFLPPILTGKAPKNSPGPLEGPVELNFGNHTSGVQKNIDKKGRKNSDLSSSVSSSGDSTSNSPQKLPGLFKSKANSVSSLQPMRQKKVDLARSPSCPVLPSDYDSDDELTLQDLSASTLVISNRLHRKAQVDGIRLPEILGGSANSSPQPSSMGLTPRFIKDVKKKSHLDPPSNRSTPRKLQQQTNNPAALLLPLKDRGHVRRTKKNKKSPPVDKTSCQSTTSDSGVSSDPQASEKSDKTIHNDVIEESSETEVNDNADHGDSSSLVQQERCREWLEGVETSRAPSQESST